MGKKIYHYPFWIRLWHWVNAVLCILLIFSGLSMQYSDPQNYFISFDVAVSMHNVSGILLTLGYIGFLIGNIRTSNGSYYKINWSTIGRDLIKQLRYYMFGMFRKEKTPFPINDKRKLNPLQKVTYDGVMYLLLPLLIITGWALLFPEIILDRLFGVSGLQLNDLVHIITGFLVSIFLVVHIYFSTIGATPSAHFEAMINGYHKMHDEPESH
ncbi:MAG: cytochrome b/b6 domain-containing protein [Bacteroidales bacterium]|nr:cytochrome b/b6 domain-containing protein [Bacteroidales bacterium]